MIIHLILVTYRECKSSIIEIKIERYFEEFKNQDGWACQVTNFLQHRHR